jgi:hypothetical protein
VSCFGFCCCSSFFVVVVVVLHHRPFSLSLVTITTFTHNNQIDDEDVRNEIDFMYSDTGLYSCIGVEWGGQPLATSISHLTARGRQFDLDVFGGVMFTRADNVNVNSVLDFKDKIIGAQSISDFAGAQVQFYVMYENGLDYIMDPKQVIFTRTF